MPISTIHIGNSGLAGFSKQLETIGNNVANLNTPGFKGATSQFTALFSGGGESAGISGSAKNGAGLATLPSAVSFAQGQINQTGNELDVAIDGRGFFVLRGDTGEDQYSRDGRFNFNSAGILVNAEGARVQALGADGGLHDISLEGVRTSPASATTTIKLGGTLSTADSTKVVSGINVTDAAGGSHTLSIEFKNNTAASAGSWAVTVKEGGTTVATGEVRFASGLLDPAFAKVALTYNPANVAPMTVNVVLDAGTTSAASGTSSLAVSSVDGWGVGTLTNASFDDGGKLALTYSNGQQATPQTLALASFGTTADLEQSNGTSFRAVRPDAAVLGVADGQASTITPDSIEGSNVDLSRQFSAIIITQRGYQASSELISTANQMLETLMRMKG